MPDSWLCQEQTFEYVPNYIQFKAISENDMAFLAKLYASTRWQELQQVPWPDQQRMDFLNQQFQAQHKHYQEHYPKADYLLIQKAGESIGRIYIDREPTSICLIDIAFLPESRNQGLGTKMIKELLAEARSKNIKVTIHVENFNPAYKLYQKLGFQQIEDKGVYQYMEWHPSTK